MTPSIKNALLTIPAVVVSFIGWQWYQTHFPSWDEEVQLSDGRLITVHRAHKLNTDHVLVETTLTLDLPELGGKRTWTESLYPAIVDIHQGQVYVVGQVTYKSAWQYKYPRYGFAAYRYTTAGWQRMPFIDLPPVVRERENIAYCIQAADQASWQVKQTGWCNSSGDFVVGLQRTINVAAHESRALEQASRANTTVKSE